MLQAEMSKKVSQICSATKGTILGTFDFNWFSSFNNQYHRKFYSPYKPQQVDTNISGKDRTGSILNLWNASWDLLVKTIGCLSLG
jgi:hypothetical protein